MSTAGADAFNHALHTANTWLADLGSAFGTRDRRFVQRALRTWLHALRDRLTVDAAAKFGAQLPELLRGAYFEGWVPSRVPAKHGVDAYVQQFAEQAGIRRDEVPVTARTITDVLGEHMSPGQLSVTLAELPTDLRATIAGSAAAVRARDTSGGAGARADDRVARLEDQVVSLTEAVRTLAHGLEGGQLSGLDEHHLARAARLADEMLIAAASQPSGR
jgi:uncharacterized protein (DUF2267 family)